MRWILCALLCAALREAPVVAQTEPPIATKHVLLLRPAGEVGPFRGKFDIAFDQAIRATAANPIQVYEEDIDVQRFAGVGQSRLAKEYLRVKYTGRSIDVIVAQGMNALLFARENRALFGDPPIVTRVTPLGQMSGPEKITGLQGGYWVKGTIDLGVALLPDTRNVVVIDGALENNAELQADIERQMQDRRDGLTLTYLRDLPLNDVIARVAAAPPHSIVLFVKQTKLDDRQNVDQFAALAKIADTSPLPIFSYLEQFLGYGVVGGYMSRVEEDATRMAEMARRIANGTPVAEIPPGRASYDMLIDWRQLQRWRIPEARVPSGTAVMFRQSTRFEQNWRYVAGSLLIFLAQFGLILALLVHRSRRRLAEEESRKSEERYRSVVDTQSEFIRRFLPDTTLTFVNDAYCRFRNATRDELLGTKFIDLIPEPARGDTLERLKQLTSGVDTMEYSAMLADGTIGWHHWTNHPICDDRGRIVEFQGVGRDITEQRRAQEALAQSEARNSAMLRAVPDLMFVLLRDGTYVDYHARDPQLLFAPPSVFVGKNVRDIMPPRLADVMMEAIEGACEREDIVIVEYDLPLDDTRYFEARIVHAGGDRVLSMVRDVTDAKRANALNRDLAGRLVASQEVERRRIARELHDDISQKVALLNIGIDEVVQQVATGEARARLQQLGQFTKEVAGDLRDLSHELHGSRLQSLGLVAAIDVLCRDTSKHIGVTVPFTHGVLPQDVDPNVSLCLYRIVQEALSNIARHSRARHAQVTLICENRTLTLQIADSGVGFDPHSTRQSGLGLISMRDRVAFLRGQLAIHAAPGGGTRIGVNVPVRPLTDSSSSIVSRSA